MTTPRFNRKGTPDDPRKQRRAGYRSIRIQRGEGWYDSAQLNVATGKRSNGRRFTYKWGFAS